MITRSRVALAATTITGLAAISPAMASASTNVAVCGQADAPCSGQASNTFTLNYTPGSPQASTDDVNVGNFSGGGAKGADVTVIAKTDQSVYASNRQSINQSNGVTVVLVRFGHH